PAAQPPPWHSLEADEVLSRLRATGEGLSQAEALERLRQLGPNVIQQARPASAAQILWRQVNNPLIYVLLGSAVLAILLGKGVDGLVVLGVVVVNTIIGFLQEHRASRAIAALSDMVPQTASVLRDGKPTALPAADLVDGDIVLLQSGDKVPSDLRLLAAKNLNVEEAALTGESVPVSKRPEPAAADAALGDRRSLLFGGTLVTSGTGTGVVVATGARTELGRISEMLEHTEQMETPFTKALTKVGRVLTLAILVVAAAILGVGLLRGYNIVDALLAAITLAVAAIPEGLPAVVTIALAIGVRRMAARNALVRKLPAVETLGSTSTICTDKTGTLTRNEMTVQGLWTASSGALHVSGVGYAPEGKLEREGTPMGELPADLLELLRAGVLCNDASLKKDAKGAWTIVGDPTEGALIVAARKAGLNDEQLRADLRRLDAIPFESEHQFMATVHEKDGERFVYVKGAPEVIARRCTGADTQAIAEQVEAFAARGMRVLAFARGPLSEEELEHHHIESGLTFLGLQGMIDPPRPEAIEAVRRCQAAGITVKMITGDHAGTAKAIAGEIGILNENGVLTGNDLARLNDDQFKEKAATVNVFARVAPEQKLRLVRALEQRGEIVAMTGDGVNDAPALKQADIGVAMGITGTAVARDAANLVLTDDNFASIAAAVEEGRRVYDNLVKALAFVLPTNLGEAMLILLAVMFAPFADGHPIMPILPVQILWINLVATISLALPLAFEAPEPNVMQRQPRSSSEPVINSFIVARTVLAGVFMTGPAMALFLWEFHSKAGGLSDIALREAQTTTVTMVILFQCFYLLSCRSLHHSALHIGLWSNPKVYGGIATILVLHLAFIYLPLMNAIFQSAPIGAISWLKASVAAVLVVPAVAVEKWLWLRHEKRTEKMALRPA
ncbi:MAG TPA: HAD-IC family P-type ATPase, partial [Planctomycetota bacterium]|nr:HAD-IC family P-type ATPase [Planctomycetota bacterium]